MSRAPASAVAPKPRPVLSIRWIVTGTAVFLTAAAALSVGFVSERNARGALADEIETRLLLQARNLAIASAGALLGDFPELTLNPLLKKMLVEQPELAFAVVLDHRGHIQGHADARLLGTRFAPPEGLRPLARARRLEDGEALHANARLLVAETAVRQADGRMIGTALIGLERTYVELALAASRRQQAIVLAVFVALGVAAAFVFMAHLLRPMSTLRTGLERIGRGDLDTPIRLKDRTELGLLAEAVNDMAGALKGAQRELIERERLSHEVDLARQIQRSLLPARPLAVGRITVQGEQRAAAEVGGDYYDILPLRDGRIAIAIADVAGKGLAGCLVMTMLSTLLRALRDVQDSPAAMLATLDERLAETLPPGVFVTMFYGVLDPAGGRLVWASAGHNPALVYRHAGGHVERCTSRGIPLAALRGGLIRRTLRDHTVELGPGDVLVQYTDGYTEAFSAADGTPFGLERVEDLVARHGPHGASAVLEALREGLRGWTGGGTPDDDETALVVECGTTTGEPAPASPTRSGAGAERTHGPRVPGPEDEAEPAEPGDRSHDAQAEALERLAEAEQRGHVLRLPARLDALGSIRGWMGGAPGLGELDPSEATLLVSALYEVCANIIEHGCGQDASRSFDLWWVPPVGAVAGARSGRRSLEEAGRFVRQGHFVARDDGSPFSPGGWRATDFSDARLRKRGRGLGLDIIHRVMREVAYHPATPRGNITLLAFGPQSVAAIQKGV